MAAPELASTPPARPVAELAAEALSRFESGSIDFTRAAVFHDLGLYTLHAVFRI